MVPPRDALIADDSTPANRGRAFGFNRAADTAGAVVGPLIGLGLYELIGQKLRPLFFIAFIPAAISVGLIFLVRERPHPQPEPDTTRAHWSGVRPAQLPPRYWRVVTVLGAFALVNFSDTLLLLRATDLGLGFTGVALLYVLYNLSYATLSYPAGAISDRVPRRIVFAVGLILFGVAYTGLGLVNTSAWLWALFITLRRIHRSHRRRDSSMDRRPRSTRRDRHGPRNLRRTHRNRCPHRVAVGRTRVGIPRTGTPPLRRRRRLPAGHRTAPGRPKPRRPRLTTAAERRAPGTATPG